jgi:hypothetical protein
VRRGFGITGEGILDALRDLFLIEYCREAMPNTINEGAAIEQHRVDLRHSSASRRFQTGFVLTSRSRRMLIKKINC